MPVCVHYSLNSICRKALGRMSSKINSDNESSLNHLKDNKH